MPYFFSSHKARNGQAVLLVTLALIPMVGIVGLVTDVGYMNYLRNSAQAAADSAALAASYRLNKTISGSTFTCDSYNWICKNQWSCPSNITSATNPPETACLYARQNGFSGYDAKTNPNQNVTITSDVTPTIPTAPGVGGVGYWITVRVSQTVPQLFSAILGNTTGVVSARATAALHPGLGCVYALDPIASGSFSQNGGTNFTSACGIYVDSSDPQAMLGVGGAVLKASTINDVGNYSWQGTIDPTPNTGISPFPDPLSYLQAPSPCSATTGCDSADCSAHPKLVTVSSDTTLLPGTYCGGIKIKSGTATFSAGNYIIVGGGISTQDTNSHVRGSGAMFYNTYNSSNTYTADQFNANSDVQLSAPTSGTYAGVLFMQDRGCCTSSMPIESFQGGATSFYEGILYFPRSLVQFAGNPSLDMAHYTIIISRRFSVQGSSTMNNDYSNLVGGNPIKQVGLVE